jgi:succinyl-diaminopimelate desuccinylase
VAQIILAFNDFARKREQKISKADAPPGSPRQKVWGRLSFTMLGGGEKENIIPSEAWTRFDMRLLPEENPEDASSEIKTYFDGLKNSMGVDARLSFNQVDSGYLTEPSAPLVQRFADATAAVFGSRLPIAASLGGDDGKFLFERGIPVISYGAIAEDSHFHGKDEFIRLSDLKNVKDVLVHLIG